MSCVCIHVYVCVCACVSRVPAVRRSAYEFFSLTSTASSRSDKRRNGKLSAGDGKKDQNRERRRGMEVSFDSRNTRAAISRCMNGRASSERSMHGDALTHRDYISRQQRTRFLRRKSTIDCACREMSARAQSSFLCPLLYRRRNVPRYRPLITRRRRLLLNVITA